MKTFFFSIPLCFLLSFCNNEEYPYTFYSIKNFRNTPVEKLARYVYKNDTVGMVRFFKRHPDIDIDTPDRYFKNSLLEWSIFISRYEAFHCLLEHGANPNYAGYKGETPLYYACQNRGDGHVEDPRFCKELVKRGVDINQEFHDGITPLSHATIMGNKESAKILVENGADLTVGKRDYSIADWALMMGYYDLAEFFICENNAPLYNIPHVKKDLEQQLPQRGDSDYEERMQRVSAKKRIWVRIKEHLNNHPEQLQFQYHIIRTDPLGNVFPDPEYTEEIIKID